MARAPPRILISPPAADSYGGPYGTAHRRGAKTEGEEGKYKDESTSRIRVVEPSAIGADETDRQLAQMRARYGAYLEMQDKRVRAGDEAQVGKGAWGEVRGV